MGEIGVDGMDAVFSLDLGSSVSAESYWHPTRIVQSAWLEHAPFAFWLMNVVRPSTYVELGTHNGFSFFTFCEAARRLRLDTTCFALDSWEGDDHAGYYGEEIFQEVREYAESRYPRSAVLLRGYFDESVSSFDDNSIDLLHIDGRHGYEDVKADFESWLPKMSASGVVLFHDVVERESDFGVWRLWEELETRYDSFLFEHGHGLGVVAVGPSGAEALRALLVATPERTALIRDFYRRAGRVITDRYVQQLDQQETVVLRAENARLAAEAESALSRAEEAMATVEQVTGSYSWAATKPLRSVVGLIPQAFRHRLRNRNAEKRAVR
jgi:hypothetical protein